MNYPQLAWALLQGGDTPRSVIAFLRADYGLDTDQAKAALILAELLPAETRISHTRPQSRTARGRVECER